MHLQRPRNRTYSVTEDLLGLGGCPPGFLNITSYFFLASWRTKSTKCDRIFSDTQDYAPVTIKLLAKQTSQLSPAFSEVYNLNNEVAKLTQFPDSITVALKMRRRSFHKCLSKHLTVSSLRVIGWWVLLGLMMGRRERQVKCGNILREEMKTVMCFRKTPVLMRQLN